MLSIHKTMRVGHAVQAPAILLCLGMVSLAGSAFGSVIFSQDFTGSTTVSDYFDSGSAASSGKFTDIAANGKSTVAIANDDLVFTDGNDDYGLYRDGLVTGSGVMSVSIVFSVSNQTGQPLFRFQVGSYYTTASVTDYSNQLSNIRFDDMLGRGQTSTLRLETAGGYISSLAWDAPHTMVYLLNNSGSTQNYTGPDSVARSLDDGHITIFMDGAMAIDNAARLSGSGDLSTFRIQSNWSNNSALAIDSVVIDNTLPVPEPASLAMLALGGSMILRRRRA